MALVKVNELIEDVVAVRPPGRLGRAIIEGNRF